MAKGNKMTELENDQATAALEIAPEDVTIDTGWENPPELKDLKYDLEQAQSHHEIHVTEVNEWLDNLNVTGSAKLPKAKNRSSVVPKLIRKQAEWRYAALSEPFLSTHKLFDCEARTYADIKAAQQSELLLNYQFNCKMDLVRFIDHYVRAAVDEGSVLVRTGWTYEEEEVEVPNIVQVDLDPNNPRHSYMARMLEQASQMLLEGGMEILQNLPPELAQNLQATLEAGHPVMIQQDGMKKITRASKNHPTAEVCEYENLVIDPSCKGDLDEAGFMAFEFETSRSRLEKENKYENLDNVNWQGNATNNKSSDSDHEEDTGSFNFKDEARKLVKATEYWGFWDIDGSGLTVPIVATWIGNTLIRLEESPFPDKKLPFVLVQYLPRRRNVYGESDGSLLEDNQKIIGAVSRGMIDIMGRSANGQIGMRKDALDLTNQRKFEAGKDYYFNPQVDPRAAVYTHTFPEIPQSAPFMIQMQHNEAEALTGVKAFHGGISGEGLGDSATAARSALDAASKRELGILRRLSKGMTDIARKFMAMNGIFLSEEEVIRVTDEEFVTIQRDDLAGKYDIKLKISTAEADNAKAQELAFMLQTMGNNLPPQMTFLVMAEIARLRKMPDLAKQIETYQPEPDPHAEALKELELREKTATIEKLESERDENLAEARASLADADLSEAKADNERLGFVEQESGVTQERDLEKQGEQAASQLQRDIINASLNSGNSE
jgi:hypothetical protein